MAIIYLFLLVAVFFSVAFGMTRLLLKHSPFEEYTIEGSFLLGPMLTVLGFSLCGYYRPASLSPVLAWVFVLAAMALSAYVGIRDRQALRQLMRDNGRRIAIILAGAAWAAVVVLRYFPSNIWSEFYYLKNQEYLNYVQLAAVLTGQLKPGDSHFFLYDFHPQIRYGQDLIAATVALIGGRHPINVVLPLSIFYRFQYAVILGVALHRLAGPRSWLVPLLLFLDGVLLVQTFSFTSSFMSSNCTLPVYLAYVALLHHERPGWRGVTLFVLANIYFLITYPEFLALVKLFEIALLGVWLARRQWQRCGPVLLANVLVCLLHPLLVIQKIKIVLLVLSSDSGWNCFGDPRVDPIAYLSNLYGLHYPYCLFDPLARWPWLAATVVVLLAATILLGSFVLAVRLRLRLAVAFWMLFMLALHLKPLLRDEPHFYAAIKFATQTSVMPMLALLALGVARSRVLSWSACTVVGLWASVAAFVTFTVYAQLPKGSVIRYPKLCNVLAAHRGDGQPVAALVEPPTLWGCALAANECGLPFVPVSNEQRLQLIMPEPGQPARASDGTDRRVVFEGLVFVDGNVQSTHRFASFEFQPTELLGSIYSEHLYRGRILHGSRVDPPGGRWISTLDDWQPTLYAAGKRLVLRGVLPQAHSTLPYRFHVRVPQANWAGPATIDAFGFFEAAVTLPDHLIGQVISLSFALDQACPTHVVNPHWRDPRIRMGFVVHSIAFEESPPSPAAPLRPGAGGQAPGPEKHASEGGPHRPDARGCRSGFWTYGDKAPLPCTRDQQELPTREEHPHPHTTTYPLPPGNRQRCAERLPSLPIAPPRGKQLTP